jgi:hypothetical protein
VNERDNFLAMLRSGDHTRVPVWLMGFESEELAEQLLPKVELPEALSHNPESFDYPRDRLTDPERRRLCAYSRAVLRPAVAVGWGANLAFGHGGPGEFRFRVLQRGEEERTLLCETGCKRLVRKHPHFFRDFDYPLHSVAQWGSLALPDPRDPTRYQGVSEDAGFLKREGFVVAANLNGFFSAPHYFCLDYQEFLASLLLDRDNAARLIGRLGDWTLAAAEELLARGVECLTLCDDLGNAENLLVGPEVYESLILPWHRRLCALAHEHGAFVHLHSHGNIRRILPLVLSSGIDLLNPFDRSESMDLVSFLREYADSGVVPVGGLHREFFEWEEDTRRGYLHALFREAGATGAWVLMDPAGIPPSTSREEFLWFLQQAEELRSR